MSAGGEQPGEGERVEELLRVNGELAAEVRSLAAGRIDAPRSAAMPTSRRLGVLLAERDELRERLAAAEAELESWAERGKAWDVHRDELESANAALAGEVARLRSGVGGFLLRGLAALRGRRPS